ncbi:MAG: fatty acid desaturase, partial [Mesorhizobium sp.]
YWPVLMLPQGILIVFLFTLLHETVHRTAFETQWLNDAVARLCSLAIALPADWFRYFHFAHHRFTQDPQNDPELAFPKPETLRQYIVHVSGLPVWWGHFKTLYRNASGRCRDSYVPSKGLP